MNNTTQYIMQRYLLILLILGFAATTKAQTEDPAEHSRVEEVTIIGTFEPIVKDAYKIRVKPEIVNETVKMPIDNYSIASKPVLALPEMGEYKAAPIPKFKADRFDKNYLRLGFGNYTTPLAEFFANSNVSRRSVLSLHLKHLSSQGGIDGYPDNAYSHNLAEIGAKQISKSLIFSENIWFKRDVVHYYGFKHPDSLPDVSADSIKQRYADMGVKFDMRTDFLKYQSDVNFNFGVGYDYFYDYFKTSEQTINVNGGLAANLEMFDFCRYQTLGLDIDANFWSNSYDTLDNSNASSFEVTPYFSAKWDEYSIKLGAKLGYQSDSSSAFHIFPAIEAGVNVIPEKLQIFVGLGGGIHRNSFRSLATQNPFISTYVPLSFSNQKFKVDGGVNANIIDNLSLSADVTYSVFDDYSMFINNYLGTTPVYTFTTISDNVNVLDIGIEAQFDYQQLFALNLGARFYSYTTDSLKYAYHKPDYKIFFNASVFPIEKLTVTLGMNLVGQQYVLDFDNATATFSDKKLDGTFDLNLMGEYLVIDNLTAFLRLNNLLNNKYEVWNNYPTQGFNAMAGITFSF